MYFLFAHTVLCALFALLFRDAMHSHRLGFHYARSNRRRAQAFKYKVKAADQAISRGAFNDGLIFAQSASGLGISKAELRVLLEVITSALQDLAPAPTPGIVTARLSKGIRRLSKSFGSPQVSPQVSTVNFSAMAAADPNSKLGAYLQLKSKTELALEKMTMVPAGARPMLPGGNVDAQGFGSAKNRMLMNREPSARLTWQPSYVASKNKKSFIDDDSDDDGDKKCCVIS